MGELPEVIRISRSHEGEVSMTEMYDKTGRGMQASMLALSYHTMTYTTQGCRKKALGRCLRNIFVLFTPTI